MKNKQSNIFKAGTNVFYNLEFDDHYKYPILTTFINRYGIYPSTYEKKLTLEYDELISRLDSIHTFDFRVWEWKSEKNKHELDYFWFDLEEYTKIFGLLRVLSIDKNKDSAGNELLITSVEITFLYDSNIYTVDKISDIIDSIITNDIQEIQETNTIHLVYQDESGLDLHPFKISEPEMDLELNYGEGFKEQVHDYLLEQFKNKEKGIAFFHGPPGTGKTMYLRYLINILASKERYVIYIPPDMVNALSQPDFLPFLAEYPDSILIIEDAEETIRSRKSGYVTTSIFNLLSIADGLLSDCLNLQIIATFNDDIRNVDEALLRKGRLMLMHYFRKLKSEEANKLANKIGAEPKYKNDVALAEIYNQKDKSYISERKPIGLR